MPETLAAPVTIHWDHRWQSIARCSVNGELVAEVSMNDGVFTAAIGDTKAPFPTFEAARQHVNRFIDVALQSQAA